jgi:single-stranded-DNA-specific exonuclease
VSADEPPRIVRRAPGTPHDWAAAVHPVLQRVYAARGVTCPGELGHRLGSLLPPAGLGGLERAVALLAAAIEGGRRIVIAGDYDCDGATGCAVGVRGLRLLGAREVGYVVPNRAIHGYGLTPALVASLAPAPDVIVTVDNGIASVAGVAAAKARGCTVIVTDHHLAGPVLPQADAIVDPNVAGDAFPSKALCGVGVMFYLLLALRAHLRAGGAFAQRAEPDLAALLDLVALGTVADLVPLDANNRALVEGGLRRMRAGAASPGLAALFEVSGRSMRCAVASDLGFAIGPRLNAAGRLEDMAIGVECLLADDRARAHALAATLHAINAERRDLQASMVEAALARVVDAGTDGAIGIALFDAAWHPGVVGLVAARIKEQRHRPVVAFAPAGEGDELRGSARSVTGFHIRDALAEVDARHPGLILRFGGHAMAAGLTLPLANYPRFAAAFDAVVRERIGADALQPVLTTDGELAAGELSLELARQLRVAGPWGQGFPAPLFDNVFECTACRALGGEGAHRRLTLRDPRDGQMYAAARFRCTEDAPAGVPLRVVYEATVNDWRGRDSLQLLVRDWQPA